MQKYGYAVNTIYDLAHDLKNGKLSFFQETKYGPKERQTPEHMRQLVINYRGENLSAKYIYNKLSNHRIHWQ